LNPTAPNHPTVPFLHPLLASLPLQHSDNANQGGQPLPVFTSIPESVVAVP
jgi:hypothetical protein